MNCPARAHSEGRCRGMNETGNGPRRQFELGTDGPGAIVVGIDRSTPSLRAAASAAGLARRQRTRLVAVYVRTQPTALLSLADHSGIAITGRSTRRTIQRRSFVTSWTASRASGTLTPGCRAVGRPVRQRQRGLHDQPWPGRWHGRPPLDRVRLRQRHQRRPHCPPPTMFVGDDTSNGTFPNAGRLWRITP
jgi:hypothetical protein